jgi:pyruvate carboxylase
MNLSNRVRQSLTALVLVLVLAFTTACSGVATKSPQANYPTSIDRSIDYGQIARGDSASAQEFGNWVVETSKGLIKDAFVRDNNKLGAVISSQVRPNEVKALAQSLAQGFRKNFPNQDLTVLMYAPNKELILTARYDAQSKQIEYQAAS